ncbi:hypothetical protein [Thiogranum longum]
MPIASMPEQRQFHIHYYVTELPDAENINARIWEQYLQLRDDADLKRTHYFNGRYENIYVPEARLPALQPVLRAASHGAADYLQGASTDLKVGFWFNEMGPGHVTLPHNHDEQDELVSGVYYVRVPPDSGRLVLRQGITSTWIEPAQGLFVFFAPDVMHEVTINNSDGIRLSIGMNFGPVAEDGG